MMSVNSNPIVSSAIFVWCLIQLERGTHCCRRIAVTCRCTASALIKVAIVTCLLCKTNIVAGIIYDKVGSFFGVYFLATASYTLGALCYGLIIDINTFQPECLYTRIQIPERSCQTLSPS